MQPQTPSGSQNVERNANALIDLQDDVDHLVEQVHYAYGQFGPHHAQVVLLDESIRAKQQAYAREKARFGC